jgi:hypothetical protein
MTSMEFIKNELENADNVFDFGFGGGRGLD